MSNSFATGIPDYPFDVEEFIDRREICDHFRGEEPYDADRAKFLTEQILEACTGTDRELQKLKQSQASAHPTGSHLPCWRRC